MDRKRNGPKAILTNKKVYAAAVVEARALNTLYYPTRFPDHVQFIHV